MSQPTPPPEPSQPAEQPQQPGSAQGAPSQNSAPYGDPTVNYPPYPGQMPGQAYAPMPPQGGGLGAGIIGLIIGVAILVLSAASLAGYVVLRDDDTKESASKATTEPTATSSKPSPTKPSPTRKSGGANAEFGEAVELSDDIVISVEEPTSYEPSRNAFPMPQDGETAVAVTLTVENQGDVTRSVYITLDAIDTPDVGEVEIIDKGYDTIFDDGLETISFSESMEPGEKVTVTYAFVVPADAPKELFIIASDLEERAIYEGRVP